MASQFAFSVALTRKAKKQALDYVESLAFEDDAERIKKYDEIYNLYIEIGLREFEDICETQKKTKAIWEKVNNKETAYWIGISPDNSKISLSTFSTICKKFVERVPVEKFVLAYEQRGKSVQEMGNGFHAHIMIWVKKGSKSWRSKAEILRDCQSTFNKCCVPECINVQITNNPKEIIQNYLVDYASKDEHKIATKEIDLMWRNQYGIKNIYENEDVTLCLSSPDRTR